MFFIHFFFNDPATTEIYTLSLHDALPISPDARRDGPSYKACRGAARRSPRARRRTSTDSHDRADPRRTDRKSTRLNSSHSQISYAVFCLKKKKKKKK